MGRQTYAQSPHMCFLRLLLPARPGPGCRWSHKNSQGPGGTTSPAVLLSGSQMRGWGGRPGAAASEVGGGVGCSPDWKALRPLALRGRSISPDGSPVHHFPINPTAPETGHVSRAAGAGPPPGSGSQGPGSGCQSEARRRCSTGSGCT